MPLCCSHENWEEEVLRAYKSESLSKSYGVFPQMEGNRSTPLSSRSPMPWSEKAPASRRLRRAGKSRFGEKTTHYEFHLKTLLEWFDGDVDFIHLIRNPVDTFASQKFYAGRCVTSTASPGQQRGTSPFELP